METTRNVLELSPCFARMSEEEQEEALRYYAFAANTAKAKAALEACPVTDPSARRAVIDFGNALAEPFKRIAP